MTAVLDYGVNNLNSVRKAIRYLGFPVEVTQSFGTADRLILPGVGAFGEAMRNLAPFVSAIRAFADSGRPVLGICLGQQLLFESSEELGQTAGLGLLAGHVRYFRADSGLKVPHMGWSPLTPTGAAPLFVGIPRGSQVYFVHSLVCEASGPDIAATAQYGQSFAASVQRGNVFGVQFHPEKSGDVGLQILRNFLCI